MQSAQRQITSFEAETETREEMVRAILKMLSDGLDPITNEDLQVRHAFTTREIEAHGDEARAEARRRYVIARAEC